MKTLEVSAGGIIKNEKGEIAIARQPHPFVPWSLPKGHVEPGEGVLDAAKREIWEETGIKDLSLVRELTPYQRPMIDKNGKEDLDAVKELRYFLFTTTQNELKPVDKDNPEALWVKKEEVIGYLRHPKDIEFFKSIIDLI